jgi:hypothetical protein
MKFYQRWLQTEWASIIFDAIAEACLGCSAPGINKSTHQACSVDPYTVEFANDSRLNK